jgi:hypothetical protein
MTRMYEADLSESAPGPNPPELSTKVPFALTDTNFGASGFSVGLRVELKPAAVEVDGRLEVLPVAESAC